MTVRRGESHNNETVEPDPISYIEVLKSKLPIIDDGYDISNCIWNFLLYCQEIEDSLEADLWRTKQKGGHSVRSRCN
jgi:hypothetical protein